MKKLKIGDEVKEDEFVYQIPNHTGGHIELDEKNKVKYVVGDFYKDKDYYKLLVSGPNPPHREKEEKT